MAQLVEGPLCEVAGLTPAESYQRLLKMIQAALLLGAQQSRARNQNWSGQCQYNVTGGNIKSSVCGVIYFSDAAL